MYSAFIIQLWQCLTGIINNALFLTWPSKSTIKNNQFGIVLIKTNTSSCRLSIFSCWSINTNMIINFNYKREKLLCYVWFLSDKENTRKDESHTHVIFQKNKFWPNTRLETVFLRIVLHPPHTHSTPYCYSYF